MRMRIALTTNFPADTAATTAWVNQVRMGRTTLDERIESVGRTISAGREVLAKERKYLNALLAQKRAGVQ